MMKSVDEWTEVPIIASSLYPPLREALQSWWDDAKRDFLWRKLGSPYAIFLAEFLLQKTQVSKVEISYREMIDAYPRIEDLAQASRLHLEQVFQWLGLVKRARFIREAAEIVAEQYRGEIPRSLQELKQLPGIGDYTANAILCFGFGQANPVVDSAIARVLKRLLGFRTQKKAWEDKITWTIANEFLDQAHPIEHNYSLIDLAALICLPRQPLCQECPVQEWCSYSLLERDAVY